MLLIYIISGFYYSWISHNQRIWWVIPFSYHRSCPYYAMMSINIVLCSYIALLFYCKTRDEQNLISPSQTPEHLYSNPNRQFFFVTKQIPCLNDMFLFQYFFFVNISNNDSIEISRETFF